VVVEEADESLYWLEHIRDCGFLHAEQLAALIEEAGELLRILGKSYATAQAREEVDRSERRARHRRRRRSS
jgi:four helix bundle protein